MLWFICEDKKGRETDESLKSELKKIFEDQGQGWIGLGTAVAASSTGVEEVIGKLHEVVRAHILREAAKPKTVKDEKTGTKGDEVVILD